MCLKNRYLVLKQYLKHLQLYNYIPNIFETAAVIRFFLLEPSVY